MVQHNRRKLDGTQLPQAGLPAESPLWLMLSSAQAQVQMCPVREGACVISQEKGFLYPGKIYQNETLVEVWLLCFSHYDLRARTKT